MQHYDLDLNAGKPEIGLYVASGAKLPDFADPKEWLFDGTAAAEAAVALAPQGR